MAETANESSKCEKLYEDFYIGRGRDNPSMTTRMTRMEDWQEMTSEKMEKWDSVMTKMFYFGLTLAVAVIGSLIKTIFHW